MTPDQAERERLAKTAGLTKAQVRAILDPNFSAAIARNIVDALRQSQASAFAKRPEDEKAMARAFGGTETVELGVHMTSPVTQTFGGAVEVPKGDR